MAWLTLRVLCSAQLAGSAAAAAAAEGAPAPPAPTWSLNQMRLPPAAAVCGGAGRAPSAGRGACACSAPGRRGRGGARPQQRRAGPGRPWPRPRPGHAGARLQRAGPRQGPPRRGAGVAQAEGVTLQRRVGWASSRRASSLQRSGIATQSSSSSRGCTSCRTIASQGPALPCSTSRKRELVWHSRGFFRQQPPRPSQTRSRQVQIAPR